MTPCWLLRRAANTTMMVACAARSRRWRGGVSTAAMLPSAPAKSDDGYRMVASLLLLFGLVDDVGAGGGIH